MLDTVFARINRAYEFLIFLLFLLIVFVGGMQVFNRFVLNQSLSWSEEFMVYAHIWIVFLAIPVAYGRGAHIGMNLLVRHLSPRSQAVLALAVDLMWLLLAGAIVRYTTVVMGVARNQKSPALGLRMDWAYLALVIGGAYLALLALRKAVVAARGLRAGEFTGGARC
jgi:TRAP-type C4-dicarboxylate transport system permease small subunit